MIRVNKHYARVAYDRGDDVFVVPHKMLPTDMWGITINKTDPTVLNSLLEYNFDDRINAMTTMNCNYETGYYPAYYLKVGSVHGLQTMEPDEERLGKMYGVIR